MQKVLLCIYLDVFADPKFVHKSHESFLCPKVGKFKKIKGTSIFLEILPVGSVPCTDHFDKNLFSGGKNPFICLCKCFCFFAGVDMYTPQMGKKVHQKN